MNNLLDGRVDILMPESEDEQWTGIDQAWDCVGNSVDEALGCDFTFAKSSFGIYKVAKVLMKICERAMGHAKLVDNGDVDIRSSPGMNGVNYIFYLALNAERNWSLIKKNTIAKYPTTGVGVNYKTQLHYNYEILINANYNYNYDWWKKIQLQL